MRLSIDVDGVPVIRRELLGMGERVLDASPAMRDVREIVYESETKRFDSQGSHGGRPWTRPSDEWTARKLELDLDPRAEHATGALRASLTGRARGSYSRIRPNGIDVGSSIPYAKYARKRNALVSPTERERRDMIKVVQAHVISERRRPILSGVV